MAQLALFRLALTIAAAWTFPGWAWSFQQAALVPEPVSVQVSEGEFTFAEDTYMAIRSFEAIEVGKAFSDALRRATVSRVKLEPLGFQVANATTSIELSVGPLEVDLPQPAESYRIQVTPQKVSIHGYDREGLARGTARFLQLLRHDGPQGRELERLSRRLTWTVPAIEIRDAPATEWRGIMIDVARFPHTIDDVRETVELAWLTGLNRVHLHLTDDQYFTFPSEAFPSLASVTREGERRHFTRQELLDLVEFADARGVVLVPELDMPAHASIMVRARPDLFGTTDPETGESRSTGIVNMANEKAYAALDTLIGELCEVFSKSPYIHLGADEVSAGHLRSLPEYQPYVTKHKLPKAMEGDVGELYCHFVERTCEMVRQRGRRPVVWEGFQDAGTAAAPIGNDVLIMAWNLTYQPPESLIRNGFEIVNCGWDPLYVVPSQCWAATVEDALNWQVRELRQRLGGPRVLLPQEAPVLGAQMCVWEQRPDAILPASYEVLTAVADRMWGAGTNKDVATHEAQRQPLNGVVQRMLRPGSLFEARNANAEIDAAYHWRAAWPIPLGTGKVLDVDELGVVAEGSFARTTPERIVEVNRELFARVSSKGHVDTRVPAAPKPGLEWFPRRQWQPMALELTGVLELPRDGAWTFFVRANDGAAQLSLGGAQVATSFGNRQARASAELKAGAYAFQIDYHFEYVQNELNLLVQGPGMADPVPFDDFVVDPQTEPTLQLAGAVEFSDPSTKKHRSLATGKRIESSAGHQGNMSPALAVDGLIGNESGWHCGESPAALTVDLGEVQPLNRAHLVFYSDGTRYYQYTLEVSIDGEQWTKAVDASASIAPASAAGTEHKFDTLPGRYVRLNMLRNSVNPGVHVNELMVFAD